MPRQFRSDDTSKWTDGFGNGSQGDLSYSGGNFGGQPGYGYATFSGTSGQYTGTFTDKGYFNGTNGGRIGDIVLIHQSQGTGAGNWELNKITNRSGSTLTFKYPLQNSYGTGAQIVSSANWNNVSLSGTITPYLSWDGQAGGIFFLVVKGTLTVSGTINYSGSGFRGGSRFNSASGAYKTTGYSAEDTTRGPNLSGGIDAGADGGVSPAVSVVNGGGAPGRGSRGADGGSGGGGGGHANNGTTGQTNPSNSACTGGGGGASYGVASLTSMYFGCGGGGGGKGNNWTQTLAGGNGGGIIFLLAKNISVSGNIYCNGNNGENGNDTRGGGGGGAGGSILLKCQTATLGNGLVNASYGAGGSSGGSLSGAGGAGSVGRIHLDYKLSYSGSTNPTLDARQDLTLNSITTGAFLYNFI